MKTPLHVANAVHVIFPYRHPEDRTLWVFDDARFGLVQEPFVFGASEAIERLAAEKLGAVDRVKVIFSATRCRIPIESCAGCGKATLPT